MPAALTDKFLQVGTPGTVTSLQSPGKALAATSINVGSTSNWPTVTGVVFAMRIVDPSLVSTANPSGTVPGTYTEWIGTVAGATIAINPIPVYGSDQVYPAGANTQVFVVVAAEQMNRLVNGVLTFANQDGSLKTASVQAALGLTNLSGYTPLGQVPSSVTYNGNRSYDIVLPTDLTSVVSNGMRLRTTRTVSAPTQCTSLNGTNQYYSKSAPAGMTFTDDFAAGAWVKLSSYPASGSVIMSRYNGTSGWDFGVTAAGQLSLVGRNAAAGNFSRVLSYQSLPLNKWVHVSAQLDMSAFTATATTSYIIIDGVDVPVTVDRGGTNPTALVQAGNLEVGSWNGGLLPFPGKIAQAFVTSAKVTQANIRTIYSQGITSTDITALNIISAYSFNNSINDLNTTNGNNLTANGGAVATNADSPFTQNDQGVPSGTDDYAIVTKRVFSTNTTLTVQVPEGCTIPTSGGVSAVVYSSNKAPFGFPGQRDKWRIKTLQKTIAQQTPPTNNVWYNLGLQQIAIPIGDWEVTYNATIQSDRSSSSTSAYSTLSTANNSESDSYNTATAAGYSTGPTTFGITGTVHKVCSALSLAAVTQYYLNIRTQDSSGNLYLRGDIGLTVISAEPSTL